MREDKEGPPGKQRLGVRFTCSGPRVGQEGGFRPGSLRAPQDDLTEYPAPSTVVMSEHAQAGETNYTVLQNFVWNIMFVMLN